MGKNITSGIVLTEEERRAAASTPILHTIASTALIGKAARAAHADELADEAEKTARGIADKINGVVDEPTEENKAHLTTAVAMALHLASMAAADGIAIPNVTRYVIDIDANNLTALFASTARAIMAAAAADGRRERYGNLVHLYSVAKAIIRVSTETVPIRYEDADGIIEALYAIHETVKHV